MKILISGGSGLLGHAVIQQLSKSHQLFILTQKSYPNFLNIKNINYIHADLATKFDFSCFPSDIEIILHLAQSPLYKDFPNSAENIFDINIKSTQRLLEYGLKCRIKHFIYTSSGSVYEPYINLSEKDYLDPKSYYANSKLIAERLVKSYESFFDTSIFRLFFLYGPHPEAKQTLINAMIQKIQNQEAITLEGNEAGMVFTPTLTLDVANFLEIFINSNKSGLYNIANPNNVSLLDIVQTIAIRLNLEPHLRFLHDKKPIKIIPQLEKMKRDFPELQFHNFEKGLSYIL